MFGLTPKQFPQNIPCLFTTEMENGRVASLDTTRLTPPALSSPVELTCEFPYAKNWWIKLQIFNILYVDVIEILEKLSESCQMSAVL